mgnify:CR=1 FL=1|tara:strand:- start:930 stop:2303 length:1374 start_codon:yes stop_codon:yes gene_type:complete
MDSSRFIQISEQILIEYIYTDQAAPTTFNTATYPIELMRDGHTQGTYFFNTDTVSTTMGNYRDISAASITADNTQYVYLDTSIGVPYNDFDPLLTDSGNLLQTFAPNLNVEYDTMRVHFVAGFNFEGYDGIVFEALAPRRDGVMMNLASINFLKTDTPVFNPDPLLLADKLYATYIEWRVPSLFFMNNLFTTADPNGVAYKITEGQGFIGTPPITLRATGIYETIVENAYSYYNMQEINSVSILSRDIYSNLYAEVKEADDGDYFTLHGMVTGSSLSNFIAQLNSSGGNYVVFYEIAVVEQVGTVFSTTSTQVFTQTQNFDEPVLYRPIIQNANTAVSFKINLSMRLFNKADSTQIIKNASLTSFDAQKYGKQMLTLNLGVVPTVANVYNQINNDTGKQIVVGTGSTNNADTSEGAVAKLVVKTKFVTAFRDRMKVKAAISPAKIQTVTEDDGETER